MEGGILTCFAKTSCRHNPIINIRSTGDLEQKETVSLQSRVTVRINILISSALGESGQSISNLSGKNGRRCSRALLHKFLINTLILLYDVLLNASERDETP